MARLRDQDRAREALKEIKEIIRSLDKEKQDDCRQELQQTPSRILTSGLGQTLAFYASKKGIHKSIGDQIARFLSAEQQLDTLEFLKRIMTMDAKDYRRLAREALAYAQWLKRYSKALIAE